MGQRPRAKAKSRPRWRIILIQGRGEVLGTVEPPDEEAAIQKAIDVFGITDRDQQRRRGSPTGCPNIQSEIGMTLMFAGMHGADNPIPCKRKFAKIIFYRRGRYAECLCECVA